MNKYFVTSAAVILSTVFQCILGSGGAGLVPWVGDPPRVFPKRSIPKPARVVSTNTL